jgi:ESX secretion-associated protein EspG
VGRRIQLSWLEYDFLWEHLQLGQRKPILDIDSHGYTEAERAELRATAWASLAAKGLGTPGELDRELERRLTLLARPEWEIDARLHLSTAGRRTTALVAAAGSRAVLAVLEPSRLTLVRVPPDGLAEAAVSLLPPHPPGTGMSITVPADVLDACAERAGSDGDALRRGLISAGLGKAEARKIADIAGQMLRCGHFGAARTPPHRKRVRADHVVSVYDNAEGRYLFIRRSTGDRLWVTLVPATETAVIRQVSELLAALGRAWPR